ncbi:MAG: pseudouridine synthase [Planctomycetia bacterium]|nr:pseudouridine synthase [Planctomycetia bacterium]
MAFTRKENRQSSRSRSGRGKKSTISMGKSDAKSGKRRKAASFSPASGKKTRFALKDQADNNLENRSRSSKTQLRNGESRSLSLEEQSRLSGSRPGTKLMNRDQKSRRKVVRASRKSSFSKNRTASDYRKEAGSVFSSFSTPTRSTQDGRLNLSDREFSKGHRLQKVLAAAGYGSRRQCEELISTGRVEVDGQVVSELGARVLPDSQKIRVDGELLPKMKPVYLAINKPKGILCTNRDQQGRRRVIDLIPSQFGRLFSVGRLDQNSEGLLLMTNDGELTERLTHPRFEVPKKYKVQVAGLVEYDVVKTLKKGVYIAEGIVQADDVVIKSRYKQSSILEIVLKEGKNREIRRMLARLGHKVLQLQRVAIGPVKLGKLLPGEFRRLTNQEISQLYKTVEFHPSQEF